MAALTTLATIALGFDFGTKRIGIAVGQALTGSATPLTTLTINNDIEWSAIDKIVDEWQPTVFVVGLPLNADGSEHKITHLSRSFGEQLEQRYQLKTYWVDERFTSAEAERIINIQTGKQGRAKKSKDKGEIDKVAAKLIVESWFNQQN